MNLDQNIEFITDIILKKMFPDDVIVKISDGCNKGDNYIGYMKRITITDKMGLQFNYIIKSCAWSPQQRKELDINRLFFREIICYEKIFPAFDRLREDLGISEHNSFKHASCIYACSKENMEFIILEDLTQYGYTTLGIKEKYDWKTLQLIAKTMADFHALSFIMKHTRPDEYEELIKEIKPIGYVGDHLVKLISVCMRQSRVFIKNVDHRKRFEKILPNIEETLKTFYEHSTTDPFNAIIQGDSWIKNLMFQLQDEKPTDLILVDWQLCKITSPAYDLSVALFVNADSPTRREYYWKYFDFYYNSLTRWLKRYDAEMCYPRSIFEDQVKKFSLFGFIMGVFGCPFAHAEKSLVVVDLEKNADFGFNSESIKQLNDVVEDAVYFNLI